MATIIKDLGNYLQAGEELSANDAVYISDSDGKAYKFDVTSGDQTFAGIAKDAAALDEFTFVAQSGTVKGFSGLTAGAFVYASTTAAGGFQLVEPASSQKIILGIAKSATELTINGGLGIKPGGEGSGGGLDVYYTENMEGLADTSDFSTGNNASFLGGGTMQGTLALESTNPISGDNSLSYTQAVGSLNDYFASETIDVDFKQQNNDSGMTFYFTYDGNDDDLKFVVWDETNSQELTSGVELVKSQSSAKRYALSFYVPNTTTQIRWGAQVLVENAGAELIVDDVEITSNPFVFKDLQDLQQVHLEYTGALTATTDLDALTKSNQEGNGIFSLSTSGVEVLREAEFHVSGYSEESTGGNAQSFSIVVNGVAYNSEIDRFATSEVSRSSTALSIKLNAGDTVNFSTSSGSDAGRITILATAATEHVITPASQSETETKILSSNVSAAGDVSDLQFDNLIVGNTYFLSGNVLLAAVNGDNPEIRYRGASGNTGALYGQNEYQNQATSTARASFSPGLVFTADSSVLYIYFNGDTTLQGDGSRSQTFLQLTNLTSQFLAAIPTPKTAYIKDVKSSGTNGGTFTAGAWQTRDLNTLEGDTGFVSLSGNQFTLQPGKYEIEASAPGSLVDRHQIKVRNVTDSVDSIIGNNAYDNSSLTSTTHSSAYGTVTLTSSKVFEVQHQCQSTKTSNGFGINNSFGVDEVYTVLEIEKIG